ncbi:MAG: dihydrofolate reductase [Bacteroidia bacterium]|nr:dihydrofolate reductase [Bacteroidia bacterium]NNK74143.1 Pr2TM family membrane protein [Flavobacteriaceae bacterium]
MLGRKKPKPQIDQEQLELFQNAQRRIKQKKRLYYHFVLFLFGAVLLILANTVLGIGKDFTIFGREWFVYAIGIWILLFLYHLLNVFIMNRFMGKEWEKRQLDKLMAKQQNRIQVLEKKLKKEERIIEQTEKPKESKSQNNSGSQLTIIVAAGENNEIGKDNKLIWHLKDDLKRFKKLTSDHHIIMGRKTFESFPKPLPNRTHIVITRQGDYAVPQGVLVVNSLEEALEAAGNDSQPFVIGGGEIYRQAITLADKIELTRVHSQFENADTFFPKIDTSVWKEINCKMHDQDAEHDHAFSFITYVRQA